MRGAFSRRGGEKYPLPPGESISHLAEIESLGEEIFPPGGDSVGGRFRFGSPAAATAGKLSTIKRRSYET